MHLLELLVTHVTSIVTGHQQPREEHSLRLPCPATGRNPLLPGWDPQRTQISCVGLLTTVPPWCLLQMNTWFSFTSVWLGPTHSILSPGLVPGRPYDEIGHILLLSCRAGGPLFLPKAIYIFTASFGEPYKIIYLKIEFQAPPAVVLAGSDKMISQARYSPVLHVADLTV